jgi:hypothetical protein
MGARREGIEGMEYRRIVVSPIPTCIGNEIGLAPMLPLNSTHFFCLHIYSLWSVVATPIVLFFSGGFMHISP